ncbi:MAG: aspartyl/asparaginyl beta-hydroxylase domain-containing protein [Gammaproteobacteria bacterium]
MTDVSRDAQWLLRAGRVEEAEQAFMRVLNESPFDVQALNIVALASIRLGQFYRARELLERAVSASPGHAASHHHLGRAAELIGDLAQARQSYERATRLSAEVPAARLHLAAVLEQLGEKESALVHYARVMSDMQKVGKWVDKATTPPALVPLVEHAAKVVRSGRRALYFDLLEPLAAEFGRDGLTRVEQMLRIHLGEEAPVYPDPRQQPTFLFFPGMPAAPYFERDLFPWIKDFEACTAGIQAELQSLLPTRGSGEDVFGSAELARQNLRAERGEPGWTGHYFYRHGERRAANCAACPLTSRALDLLPLSRVAGHGPEVLFSVFTPGTHLLPHRGVTNTRVVAHLPLVVPADCALGVGGEEHAWQEGRVVVFDDTYEHEAWNRSTEVRVVLIFDLWNPHLTPLEQAAVAKLVVAIGEFRVALENA